MRKLTAPEQREFFETHLQHRLTALLAFVARADDVKFWQGNDDLFKTAIEGASSMLRMFIEFLGFRSKREAGGVRLDRCNARKDDVTIESFGLDPLELSTFGEHSELIAKVHEGISKGTAHLTWDSGHQYESDKHFLKAVGVVVQKVIDHLYRPKKYPLRLHPDLERRFLNKRPGWLQTAP